MTTRPPVPTTRTFSLDGQTLTVQDVFEISTDAGCRLALTADATRRVEDARSVIEDIVAKKETVYGVNTGFGLFSDVIISHDQVEKLQLNLIRSHCSGVGVALAKNRTRAMMVLRANTIAKGGSMLGSRRSLTTWLGRWYWSYNPR